MNIYILRVISTLRLHVNSDCVQLLYYVHIDKWYGDCGVVLYITHTSLLYNRFVATGSRMQAAVVPGSVKVYNYQTMLGISFREVSDIIYILSGAVMFSL